MKHIFHGGILMIINTTKFVIATKDFPLKFNNADGDYEDEIEAACFYHSAEDASDVLSRFYDEPQKHQIIKVDITYEF